MENEVSSSERKLHWDKFSPSAPQEVQETMYQAYQTTDGGRTGHGMFLKQNPKQNLESQPHIKIFESSNVYSIS